MARQATNPAPHAMTMRMDEGTIMTSGRAGKVVPVACIPMLAGDSASGRWGCDVELAEMPRPLQNAVMLSAQAWYVPKSAHPQFHGSLEVMHAYQGKDIITLGASGEVTRGAPPYFFALSTAGQQALIDASEMFRTLGLHRVADLPVNSDYIDAFNLVYNFRLAAHSSRLERRPYAVEDLAEAVTLPRAFWPKGRFSSVVPDYERALIVGAMSLDLAAGQLPISGIFTPATNAPAAQASRKIETDGTLSTAPTQVMQPLWGHKETTNSLSAMATGIFAEMGGYSLVTSLADIDKARITQAFAKLRTSYAGNDATGFDNDDAIVAMLMQGLNVPADDFKRPFLLDAKTVAFGFVERFATDSANLDKSVTQGRASVQLSLNVPRVESGGTIIITIEVLPERLDERQSDEAWHITSVDQLPNALRDIQRPEPVDLVLNRRLDARHATPGGLYGYEPMNNVWNRSSTRLGGAFYQENPLAPFTEQRSAIWQTSIVNPVYSEDHFLAPPNFPHDVFADTEADAFELVARHTLTVRGLTQIGDVLQENNDDYDAVAIGDE